jgi:hypothetical protein
MPKVERVNDPELVEELDSFASEGDAEPPRRWRLEPRFPVARLASQLVLAGSDEPLPRETRAGAARWIRQEQKTLNDDGVRSPTYYKELAEAWLPDTSVDPIVVVETPEGIIVCDGWHRRALAIAAGLRTVAAYVGSY